MSLIASPPSILGGVIPHPGLAPSSLTDITLNGWQGLASNLGDALIDATLQFRLDGTSTVSFVVVDDHATLLKSNLTKYKSWLMMDGVGFVYSAIRKQNKRLTLVFDHEIVAALNEKTDTQVVAANTTTRTGFAKQLAGAVPWIKVLTPAGDSPGNVQSALTVGNVDPTTGLPAPPTVATVAETPESYWEAMGRVLDEIGWRRFPRGHDSLYLVPDSWLFAQAPVYTLDESVPGVDSIDFEWDTRQPLAKAKIYCRAEVWAYPAGTIVALSDAMGVAAGAWLVEDISRSMLTSAAVVSITKPQPTVPEPVPATDPNAAAVTNDLGPTGGNVAQPTDTSAAANQALGQAMCADAGWTGNQWVAFNNIAMAESGWAVDARYPGQHGPPTNTAYGIPQALPPNKMASAGADWANNPATQIAWMIDYIKQRYGTPVDAWNFHLAHGSY